MTGNESSWADSLADSLVNDLRAGGRTSITWLNHYTALRNRDAGASVASVKVVGIDGQLLNVLLGRRSAPRTSADLVLPRVLARLESPKVALVGGTPDGSQRAATHLIEAFGAQIVGRWDGFHGRPTPATLASECRDAEVVVLGLGAPHQDLYLSELARYPASGQLIATCGGWLDQIVDANYYPSWAYKYRANWLIRLIREPQRLWRRYTIDAVRALIARRDLLALTNVSGVPHHDDRARQGA